MAYAEQSQIVKPAWNKKCKRCIYLETAIPSTDILRVGDPIPMVDG